MTPRATTRKQHGSADQGYRPGPPQFRAPPPPDDYDRVIFAWGPGAAMAGAVLGFRWVSPAGDWSAKGYLAVVNERLVIRDLLLEPEAGVPEAGVTSSVLRSIPVGRFLAEGRAKLLDIPDWFARGELPGGKPLFHDTAVREAMAARGTEGKAAAAKRRGRGDEYYQQVALDYLRLSGRGIGRGILRELAAERGVRPERVRDDVHEARVRGFLSPGSPGRAGAEPGPNLPMPPKPGRRRAKGKP